MQVPFTTNDTLLRVAWGDRRCGVGAWLRRWRFCVAAVGGPKGPGLMSGTDESTLRRKCPLKANFLTQCVQQIGLHHMNIDLEGIIGLCRERGVHTLEGSKDPCASLSVARLYPRPDGR